MKTEPAWLPALRWVLFAVLLINAVTLTVYFRIQEFKLKYSVSRLQAELEKEREETRGLSRDALRSSQDGSLEIRGEALELHRENVDPR